MPLGPHVSSPVSPLFIPSYLDSLHHRRHGLRCATGPRELLSLFWRRGGRRRHRRQHPEHAAYSATAVAAWSAAAVERREGGLVGEAAAPAGGDLAARGEVIERSRRAFLSNSSTSGRNAASLRSAGHGSIDLHFLGCFSGCFSPCFICFPILPRQKAKSSCSCFHLCWPLD